MRNALIKCEFDAEHSDQLNFRMEGDLSLQNMNEIKIELTKALEQSKKVCIVLKNVENIDLSCIQMLLSVHRTFKNYKEDIKIQIYLEEALINIISNSGLYQELNVIASFN